MHKIWSNDVRLEKTRPEARVITRRYQEETTRKGCERVIFIPVYYYATKVEG